MFSSRGFIWNLRACSKSYTKSLGRGTEAGKFDRSGVLALFNEILNDGGGQLPPVNNPDLSPCSRISNLRSFFAIVTLFPDR